MTGPNTSDNKPPLVIGGQVGAIVPSDIDQCWRLAQIIHASGRAPRDADDPNKIAVAMMHGMEVGLTPMAALQSIAVINGRPTLWGDGALALIQASGYLTDMDEQLEGEGENARALCMMRRKGRETPITRSFSVKDAKQAGLWGKQGPWTQYPQRMLQMRARSWAMRDGFADVMKGLHVHEEVRDMIDITPVNTPPRPTRNVEPDPEDAPYMLIDGIGEVVSETLGPAQFADELCRLFKFPNADLETLWDNNADELARLATSIHAEGCYAPVHEAYEALREKKARATALAKAKAAEKADEPDSEPDSEGDTDDGQSDMPNQTAAE